MPFVPDENHHNANFSTHVWLDDADNDGINSPYTTENEAREAFERLEAGGKYEFGAWYRWNPGSNAWMCIDAWPDDFDGGV